MVRSVAEAENEPRSGRAGGGAVPRGDVEAVRVDGNGHRGQADGGRLLGWLVFGAGFAVLQNATLTLMYGRVPAGGEGAVSAVWNAAYDLGMAAGALGAGLVITSIGYPATFILAAAVILPSLILVRRDRRPYRGNRCAP